MTLYIAFTKVTTIVKQPSNVLDLVSASCNLIMQNFLKLKKKKKKAGESNKHDQIP